MFTLVAINDFTEYDLVGHFSSEREAFFELMDYLQPFLAKTEHNINVSNHENNFSQWLNINDKTKYKIYSESIYNKIKQQERTIEFVIGPAEGSFIINSTKTNILKLEWCDAYDNFPTLLIFG